MLTGTKSSGDAKVQVIEWHKGTPTPTKVIAATGATDPALDVDAKGKAILAWRTPPDTDGPSVNVTRRLPVGGWSPSTLVPGSDGEGAEIDVALGGNGWGRLVYAVAQEEGDRVIKSNRLLVDGFGVLTPTTRISPLGEQAHDPSVDINAKGLTDECRLCYDSVRITTHYRLLSAPKYASVSTGAGYSYLNAVGVDRANDLVIVAVQTGKGAHSRFVDGATGSPYGG